MKNYVMWNTDFRDNIDVDALNKRIDDFIRLNPTLDIVLQVPSTKGATSSFVQKIDSRAKIRIAAAYDEERLDHYKNVIYDSGANCKEAHVDSVIYTRNEVIKILREIENIESGLMDNWSDFQKAMYIYDRIKTTIMYDPKYKIKSWAEIRSLRGLITKQTVCAGYAMMLKEILERQGIQCKFVTGSGHAWNVLVIDDVMYSADLTSDNYSYRYGEKLTHLSIGQSEIEFGRKRIPAKEEPDLTYQGQLKELNPTFVETVASSVVVEKDYEVTANNFTRNDGTKFYLAQIGTKTQKEGRINYRYFKYYYRDINRDGTYGEPKILYAYADVFKYLNKVSFGESTQRGYANTLINILFSRENIKDSENKGTGFLGEEEREFSGTPASKLSEIRKAQIDINRTKMATRIFTRNDNTKIIVEAIEPNDKIDGKIIYRYKVYEMMQGNSKKKVRANIVLTEENLLTTKKPNIGNFLLSRTRIENKSKEAGGYVGYIGDNGKFITNKNLTLHYTRNKKIDIPNIDPNRPIIIPRFYELEDLARTYEVMTDSKTKEIVVRNIKTKKIVKNERLALKAIFANIWLVSAGLKTTKNEQRKGIREAFSVEQRYIYTGICNKIKRQYETLGYIDTVTLFKELEIYPNPNGAKIVANLFKNEFQSNYIHNLFYNSQRYHRYGTKYPKVLYNEEKAIQMRMQAYGRTQ